MYSPKDPLKIFFKIHTDKALKALGKKIFLKISIYMALYALESHLNKLRSIEFEYLNC